MPGLVIPKFNYKLFPGKNGIMIHLIVNKIRNNDVMFLFRQMIL